MAKILCSPSKYVQGAGEMKKLGEYAQKYGKKALVLITESGYKRIGDVVNTGFEGYEITPVYEYFNRECSCLLQRSSGSDLPDNRIDRRTLQCTVSYLYR